MIYVRTYDSQDTLIIWAFYRPPSKELKNVIKVCDTFEHIRTIISPLITLGNLSLPNID